MCRGKGVWFVDIRGYRCDRHLPPRRPQPRPRRGETPRRVPPPTPSLVTLPVPERNHAPEGRCHRWLDRDSRWCGDPHPIGVWQIGPLCEEHAPEDRSRMLPYERTTS
jgi:hypothetical protein